MPAVDRQTLYRILVDMARVLQSAGVSFVVGGGLAAEAYGLRETLNDIDSFVRPKDAPEALRTLERAGYYGWIEDPRWLYKAIKDGVTVDVIYESSGLVKVGDETFQRAHQLSTDGVSIPVMPAEDLFLMKAVAASPAAPKHWLDAVSLLSSQPMDWEYLARLSKRHARKVLPAIVHAYDEGVQIPSYVFVQLARDLL